MELQMESVIQQHGAYLYRFALKLSAHPDKANELVQCTFIKAWKKQDQLREEAALRGWLRKICLNEFRIIMRKQGNQHEDEFLRMEDLELDGQFFQEEQIDIIQELVVREEVVSMRNGCFLAMSRKLTLPQRMAFSLVDMFGLSIHEASLLIDCSEGAIKGLLYRARLNLDAFFADHCHFLKEENACRCQAWSSFVHQRADMQKKMNRTFSEKEYIEKGYAYQKEVRDKVLYYYQHMPEVTPSKEWYGNILDAVKKDS